MGALLKALDWPVKAVIVKSAEIDFVDVADYTKLHLPNGTPCQYVAICILFQK